MLSNMSLKSFIISNRLLNRKIISLSNALILKVQSLGFRCHCSETETNFLVYNEELHDLLSPRRAPKSNARLELRENHRSSGVHITNLRWKTVSSVDECLKLKGLGDLARTMGSTQMNRDSSRSHTMFSLSIQHQHKNETKIFRQGKLNFVDLGQLCHSIVVFQSISLQLVVNVN